MGQVEKLFGWCLKKGEEGKRHKGLRKIKPDKRQAELQISKAISDLDTMHFLFDGGKTDWVASAAFYAMYHSILAILYKIGYESRNQECTINAIKYLIKEGKVNIDLKFIAMIRSISEEESKRRDAKTIREEMQYGTKTNLETTRCNVLMNNAEHFVEKMRAVLKEI